MTVKRILLGMLLLGGTTATARAQFSPGQAYPSPPAASMPQAFPSGPRPLTTGTGLTGTPPPLLGSAPYTVEAQPTTTLTMVPSGAMNAAACGPGGANCCGPVGGNGPITYELFTRTGSSLIVGGGPDLSGATRFGWMVEGGGRSLFMNTANDAAWTAELSLMYAYNGGGDRVLDVFARQPKNPNTGLLIGPDQIQPFTLRGVTRTGLNYTIGRDWFLNGPGFLGYEQAWNTRFGVDVGGNYGTIRVDLVPVADVNNYFRRYSVTNGIQFAAHWNAEMPVGAWIAFAGVRAQYGFHHSNVVPPLSGNFQDLNLLFTAGVRF